MKLQREKEIETYKQSIAPIPVEQYSLDGEYIASYPSMSQAAKAVGCSSGTISEFFSGKRQTAGGYKWRYANEEEEKKQVRVVKFRPKSQGSIPPIALHYSMKQFMLSVFHN